MSRNFHFVFLKQCCVCMFVVLFLFCFVSDNQDTRSSLVPSSTPSISPGRCAHPRCSSVRRPCQCDVYSTCSQSGFILASCGLLGKYMASSQTLHDDVLTFSESPSLTPAGSVACLAPGTPRAVAAILPSPVPVGALSIADTADSPAEGH